MAIDDIALGDEIGAPHAVEDLLAGHHLAGPAGEQVQQVLLDPAQVDDRRPGPDLAMEDVDLDLADA